MPDLTMADAIDATKIWSAAGLGGGLIRERPFRAPHHTASITALIGGGHDPWPGEISLAHRGVLFLDELPEFPRNALEALRQPLESGTVNLSRTKQTVVFPARFMLIAAMNPCPCGYYGDPERECTCSAFEVMKYQKRISGPLLDRIDLQIKVGRVAIEELQKGMDKTERDHRPDGATTNEMIKKDVACAWEAQRKRFDPQEKGFEKANVEMTAREVREKVMLDDAAKRFLETLGNARLSHGDTSA
jgi:magnesium chelatase family protein